ESLTIQGPTFGQAGLLACGYLQSRLVRDGPGNIHLQIGYVPNVLLIDLRPDTGVGRAPNQLHGHAYPVTGPQHGSFEQGVDLQLAGDLRQFLPRVLEVHRGGPRNDSELPDPSQVADKRFGEAIGKVLILRVTG